MADLANYTVEKVKKSSDRKTAIKNLYEDSTTHEMQLLEDNRKEELKVIYIDIDYLIYNADNTRVRTDVLQDYEIKNTDSDKFDSEFYNKRNDVATQDYLHRKLFNYANDKDANIYEEIKKSAYQRDSILIGKDGVVIDGNRRLATLRELYEENPAKYKFEKVRCLVLTRDPDRQYYKSVEYSIHFADDKKLEYTWVNKVLETERLSVVEGKQNDEIRKILGIKATEVRENLIRAQGIHQYESVLKKLDKDYKPNDYRSFAEDDIKQAVLEIGKSQQGSGSREEKNLSKHLQSMVVFINSKEKVIGKAYDTYRNTDNLKKYFRETVDAKTDKEALDKVEEIFKKPLEEQIEIMTVLNEVRLDTERKERAQRERTEVQRKITEINGTLQGLEINQDTVTTIEGIKTIIKQLEEINKEHSRLLKQSKIRYKDFN